MLVAQIDGVDASGDGGLLGIALSPSYDEDGLIYAYVTTAEDNRIIRIARGDVPKAIFTGIPQGQRPTTAAGSPSPPTGRCMSEPATPATRQLPPIPASLAGKVLRLDEFGKPAASNPTPGLADLRLRIHPGGRHVPDRRRHGRRAGSAADGEDLLLPLTAGKDYATVEDGEALWTWTAADGGAADCSISNGVLASTSLDKQQLTGDPTGRRRHLHRLADRAAGQPVRPAADRRRRYAGSAVADHVEQGRPRQPVPSDDRVVVVPSGSSGGEGGPD